MVKISRSIIAEVILKVLSGNKSREEAANWALSVREGLEHKCLSYEPSNEEDKIWDAVIFLEGIDLMDSPDSYLHNQADLEEFKDKLL